MKPTHWLYTVPLRLRSLFQRQRLDRELDEELLYHIDRKTQDYIAKGMASQEARREALIDMRGIERAKEECRDARKVNWLQELVQDTRYAIRSLLNAGSFTAIAIMTLAV